MANGQSVPAHPEHWSNQVCCRALDVRFRRRHRRNREEKFGPRLRVPAHPEPTPAEQRPSVKALTTTERVVVYVPTPAVAAPPIETTLDVTQSPVVRICPDIDTAVPATMLAKRWEFSLPAYPWPALATPGPKFFMTVFSHAKDNVLFVACFRQFSFLRTREQPRAIQRSATR